MRWLEQFNYVFGFPRFWAGARLVESMYSVTLFHVSLSSLSNFRDQIYINLESYRGVNQRNLRSKSN